MSPLLDCSLWIVFTLLRWSLPNHCTHIVLPLLQFFLSYCQLIFFHCCQSPSSRHHLHYCLLSPKQLWLLTAVYCLLLCPLCSHFLLTVHVHCCCCILYCCSFAANWFLKTFDCCQSPSWHWLPILQLAVVLPSPPIYCWINIILNFAIVVAVNAHCLLHWCCLTSAATSVPIHWLLISTADWLMTDCCPFTFPCASLLSLSWYHLPTLLLVVTLPWVIFVTSAQLVAIEWILFDKCKWKEATSIFYSNFVAYSGATMNWLIFNLDYWSKIHEFDVMGLFLKKKHTL